MPRGGVQSLSDYAGRKIVIECPCGLRRRYDADQMIAGVGDRDLPSLIEDLATAEGCNKSMTIEPPGQRRECQIVYNMRAMGTSYNKNLSHRHG